jgi:glycerol kinase
MASKSSRAVIDGVAPGAGPLTLAIDQGTRSTRAAVFDAKGDILALARRPVRLRTPDGTHVVQDADEILASVSDVLIEILAHQVARKGHIGCAGLATQRSSVVAWDRRTGRPLSPVLSWQDRRAADWLRRFESCRQAIKDRTGLRLSPHYGAGKMHWLLHHNDAVRGALGQGRLAVGPLAAFLLFHLLQGAPLCVDHANALRTLLCNLDTLAWDPWLLDLFGLSIDLLPEPRPIMGDYGLLREGSIPLTAVNGDQTAAIYSHGLPAAGAARVNIGTGAFVLLSTNGTLLRHPDLLSGISASSDDRVEYYIEGTVNGAGAAMDWAQRQWGLGETRTRLPQWLEDTRAPPIFVNTIGGLGSPWWREGAPPALIECPPDAVSASPAQAMVAVIESIAFLTQANLDAMTAQGLCVNEIRISGGLASLDGLCRRLASLSGVPVVRPAAIEATARGIAWLAAGCPGSWRSQAGEDLFAPFQDAPLEQRYRRFRTALAR